MGFVTDPKLGVKVHYGPRVTTQKFGGSVSTDGNRKEAVWVFDYNELPDADLSKLNMSLPAYSKVLAARMEVLEAVAVSGAPTAATLDIGLKQADGTAIDVDGIVAALDILNGKPRGTLVAGAGALVGASVGAAAGELVVAASFTGGTAPALSGGRMKVVVEYMVEGV